MLSKNRRVFIILLSVPFLLSFPLVAMQFTAEVNWSLSDFMVAGFLLLSTGLVLEAILRAVQNLRQRLILCALVFVFSFAVWAELAVGVFGTPFAGS